MSIGFQQTPRFQIFIEIRYWVSSLRCIQSCVNFCNDNHAIERLRTRAIPSTPRSAEKIKRRRTVHLVYRSQHFLSSIPNSSWPAIKHHQKPPLHIASREYCAAAFHWGLAYPAPCQNDVRNCSTVATERCLCFCHLIPWMCSRLCSRARIGGKSGSGNGAEVCRVGCIHCDLARSVATAWRLL